MPKKLSDGRWLVDIRPEGSRGKRIRKKFFTKPEAVRFEAWCRHQAVQEPWNPKKPDRRNLQELVDKWHELHGQSLKDGESRYAKLKAMVDRLGNPRGQDLDAKKFSDYRARRLHEDGKKPNTVNRELSYLKAVFNELERLGEWNLANPLKKVRPLKIDEPELAWLNTHQIKELLNACAASRNTSLLPAVSVCLATGARWGEAMALTSNQVRGGKITFAGTKSGRTRSVPYEYPIIDEWVRGRKGKLFNECMGAFRIAVRQAGIELPKGQLTHVCRHTFASHFMMNGGDILTLQRILGHESLAMTMRYAHFAPEHLADAPKRSPLANLDTNWTNDVERH